MVSSQEELLITTARFFDKHHILYMITGAWSVIYFGRPRASHDIDFVVEIPEQKTASTLLALKEFTGEYVIDEQLIPIAIKEKSMFQVVHLPTVIKLDIWLLKHETYDQERFKRRKKVVIFNTQVNISTAEDTILQKLRWYKNAKIEKHLIDAAFVYQIQKEQLDQDYLNKWAQNLKVTNYFKQLQRIDLKEFI